MDKKIPLWMILGMIVILGAVSSYVIYRDLNDKKDHLRKIMINKGETMIDAFEAASREFARTDYRREFWIQKLLIETSRIRSVKYIFISSPDGRILARSNIADTDYNELESIAKEKPSQKELTWEILKKGSKETLLLHRRLSPAFLPDSLKNQSHNKKIPTQMGTMTHMPIQDGPVIRFFYRNNEILQYNPKDLSIFLALDMNLIYQSGLNNQKDTIYSGIMLFALSCSGILLLFFIQNYRAAKISLGKAKKFSDALIKAMPTGFITTNTNGDIISYNDASVLIFSKGKKLKHLPKEIKSIIKNTNTKDLKRQSINKEIAICSDKFRKDLDLNISYIHAGADEKPGILILIKDETEKNTLKREISLNERLVTVGKLAAGVAHEIRNPLSSIKGFSTCIKENPKNIEQNIDISKLIISEVDRLDKVVGQLLDFAKPVNLIKEKINLKELINESVHLMSRDSLAKNIKIKNETPKDIYSEIDKDKIKQVFLNILYNSMESIVENGEIHIKTSLKDNNAVIQFSDSGPGIAQNVLPHIFDPYFTTKSTGTGIGLAISRNIIRAHQGKIYAKTDENNKVFIFIELSVKG